MGYGWGMIARETIQEAPRWTSPERTRLNGCPTGLHLVTTHDIRDLDEAVGSGRLPVDLERKLCRLAGGGLVNRYVEQTSRLIFSLLLAYREGLFEEMSHADYSRILRVLAYVRKDEDAIPDYKTDGFKDDAQEIRGLEIDLGPVIRSFKSWRLRHQVPGIWLRAGAQPDKPRDAAC